MEKPFDLLSKEPKTPEQLHLEKAAAFIARLFNRNPPLEPNSQRLVTLKPVAGIIKRKKVWRLSWEITEEYKKRAWIFSGLRPTRSDIDHHRRYVVDIYQDGEALDYIITPGQPSNAPGTRQGGESL